MKWVKTQLKQHNKKGFTLIELVVVLVIIAILAAITVPVVSGYIEDARNAEDYGKLGILNRSSSAYIAYVYKESGGVQADVFAGINDDVKRQEKLIEYHLLDEVFYSKKTKESFKWNISKQCWEIELSEDSGAAGELTGTIMDQGANQTIDEWKSGTRYQPGDFVLLDGVRYKAMIGVSDKPGTMGIAWKKIELNYEDGNYYEKGDVILNSETNTYYRGIADFSGPHGIYTYQYYNGNDPFTKSNGLWEAVQYNNSTKTWEKVTS